MTRVTVFLVAAILGAALVSPRAVHAYERDYAPWELVSSGINGALKSLGYAPTQSTATGGVSQASGVLFAGGDDGGAWRSLDCGTTWEHVNGGPGVTEGLNGGYGCPAGTSCAAHRVMYYGPPGLDQRNSSPTDFAAGPLPSMSGISGTQATYRTGKNLWWSNEDGKHCSHPAFRCQFRPPRRVTEVVRRTNRCGNVATRGSWSFHSEGRPRARPAGFGDVCGSCRSSNRPRPFARSRGAAGYPPRRTATTAPDMVVSRK